MRHQIRAAAGRLAVALTLALAALAGPVGAQTAFAPVAVVNDLPITGYELEQRMRLLAFNGAPQGPRLREIALDQLIEDRLKVEAAARGGLPVDRVDKADLAARFAQQRGTDPDALRASLARSGVAPESLEEALAADAVWRDLVRRRFGPRATATEAEIDQEIALAREGRVRSFRLAEIVIPNRPRGAQAAMAEAQALAAELRGGGDFAAAARRRSAAPSATRGGDIGWTPEANLPPAILSALDGVADGGIAGPVEVQGGVALLRLLERREQQAPWAGEGTVEILMVAAPLRDPAAAAAALTPIVAGAASCDEAQARAEAAGLRAERPPRGPLSRLPPQVRDAVSALQEGQATGAVAGSNGHAIFMMCARESGVSAEAREQVRDQLRERRLVSFADGYLQELRGDAVIELR
ncbi:MAG: peptidylprolyl isomerase [Rubrimonas sp.]|uniref:peptidylprolyl isomerase n=1 Tax=Rubrimonas sp. TaxID=2036015 RepID=UPI002FDD5E7D